MSYKLRYPQTRWYVVAAVAVLIFLLSVDFIAANMALIPIADEVHVELNTLQWILSGYVLAWAAFVIPGGRLAATFGQRRILFWGIGLFMGGSFLAAASHSISWIIVGRVIQGIGGAFYSPAVYALTFSIVPKHQQGMAMGIFSGLSGLGLAAGPSFASFFLTHLSWHWIFYINIPLILPVFVMLWLLLEPDEPVMDAPQADWIGMGLLGFGVSVLVYGLNQIENWGFSDPNFWVCIVSGIALVMVFFRRDRSQKTQTLPQDLLKNKAFMGAVLSVFLVSYIFCLILVLGALYLQTVRHYDVKSTGTIFLAMTLTLGVLAPIAGKIVDKLGVVKPIIVSMICSGVALAIFAGLDQSSPLWLILFALVLAGLGNGTAWPALNTAMFRSVDDKRINSASSLFTLSMTLGDTVGIIMITSLLVTFGSLKLKSYAALFGLHLTPDQEDILSDLLKHVDRGAEKFTAFSDGAVAHVNQVLDWSFIYGMRWNMISGVFMTVMVAMIGYYFIRKNIPQTQSTKPIVAIH